MANTKQKCINLQFDHFPLTWGLIQLQKPAAPYALYRYSNTDPTTVTSPRFFGMAKTAAKYALKHQQQNQVKEDKDKTANIVFRCYLKPDVKLVDIRLMRYMFLEHMLLQKDTLVNDACYTPKINAVMTALGLSSRAKQFEYAKSVDVRANKLYASFDNNNNSPPFDQYGSRLSLRQIDDAMVEYAKEVFYSKVDSNMRIDGYIAPVFERPGHPGRPGQAKSYFHSEICLFNPKDALQGIAADTLTIRPDEDVNAKIGNWSNMLDNLDLASLMNYNATLAQGIHFGEHICPIQVLQAMPKKGSGGTNSVINEYWNEKNKASLNIEVELPDDPPFMNTPRNVLRNVKCNAPSASAGFGALLTRGGRKKPKGLAAARASLNSQPSRGLKPPPKDKKKNSSTCFL